MTILAQRASSARELERALAGALLSSPEDRLSCTLEPSDISDPLCRAIYKAARHFVADERISPSIADFDLWLERNSIKHTMDGLYELAAERGYGTLDSLERQIREAATHRRTKDALDRLNTSNLYGAELLDLAQSAFNNIDTGSTTGGEHIGEVIKRVLKGAEAANAGADNMHKTGVQAIDRMGALPRGSVIVVAGRPGMGKTAFIGYLLSKLASQGDHCLWLQTETTNDQIGRRLVSMGSGVNSNRIAAGNLTMADWQAMTKAAGDMHDLPIWLDNKPARVSKIARAMREHRQRNGVNVVALDHVQRCIKGSDPQRELFELINTLDAVAKEDPPQTLILVSQLNRSVEKREDKRPMISDLRESGKLEEDARSIIFCYRESYYKNDADKSLLQLLVAKNSEGVIGAVDMFWHENGYIKGPRS